MAEHNRQQQEIVSGLIGIGAAARQGLTRELGLPDLETLPNGNAVIDAFLGWANTPERLRELNERLNPPHEHCWHTSGGILLSSPPQTLEICCHCGQTRVARTPDDSANHGPYLTR